MARTGVDAAGTDPARVVVRPPIGPVQARRLHERVSALLTDGRQRVVCEVQGTPDLGVVDVLARLHLLARRLGGTLLVCAVGPELADLLDLTGLAGLAADGPARPEPRD